MGLGIPSVHRRVSSHVVLSILKEGRSPTPSLSYGPQRQYYFMDELHDFLSFFLSFLFPHMPVRTKRNVLLEELVQFIVNNTIHPRHRPNSQRSSFQQLPTKRSGCSRIENFSGFGCAVRDSILLVQFIANLFDAPTPSEIHCLPTLTPTKD